MVIRKCSEQVQVFFGWISKLRKITMFFQLPYHHTYWFELFTCFLHWGMFTQSFFPNGHPYKIYKSPHCTLLLPFLLATLMRINSYRKTWCYVAYQTLTQCEGAGSAKLLQINLTWLNNLQQNYSDPQKWY